MSDEIYDLKRRIQQIEAKLQYMIQPSVQAEVTTENDPNNLKANTATVRMQHTGGELTSGTPLHQNYGYWSAPLAGAQHTVANVGGRNGRGVSIASSDERYRPATMQPGEVYVGDNNKQMIYLSGGTSILITAGSYVTITSTEAVTINTTNCTLNATSACHVITPTLTLDGDMQINGKLTVTGDVTGASISLDHHVHNGVQGGPSDTGPPVG